VSVEDVSSARRDPYRLDELGWLQFERLASLVLEAEAGLRDLDWHDRAYRGRTALVEEPVVLAGAGVRLPGPVAVAVVWVRGSPHSSRLSEFVTHLLGLARDLGLRSTDHTLVITNLDEEAARKAFDEEPLLFRHVKAHAPSGPARELVRASGLTIVEHPHFTPERIRRFVSNRLDALVRGVQHQPWPPGTAAGWGGDVLGHHQRSDRGGGAGSRRG
jgi:hypothetical protein